MELDRLGFTVLSNYLKNLRVLLTPTKTFDNEGIHITQASIILCGIMHIVNTYHKHILITQDLTLGFVVLIYLC